jgi:CRISPR-associated protein Csm3
MARDVENMPDFDHDDKGVLRLFGSASPVKRSRLQFADCFLKNQEQMELVGVTEIKTENAIRRSDCVANPRQIERVTKGAVFGVNIVYDVHGDSQEQVEEDFRLLAKGMKLLQWDYLGGHGSRGSGRVSLNHFELKGFETDTDLSKLEQILKEVESYELFAV